MAKEPRQHRIRVRGRQRDDIDFDLLVQALIQIGEERAQRTEELNQHRESVSGTEATEPA